MRLRLKHQLGAIDHGAKIYDAEIGVRNYGAELSARVTSAELPAMSPPRLLRAQDLGARDADAETCKLGASHDDAELRV